MPAQTVQELAAARRSQAPKSSGAVESAWSETERMITNGMRFTVATKATAAPSISTADPCRLRSRFMRAASVAVMNWSPVRMRPATTRCPGTGVASASSTSRGSASRKRWSVKGT